MRNTLRLVSRAFALMASVLALHSLSPAAFAQSTAFTYQGRLLDNGGPANGSYDLRLELRDTLVDGSPVGTALTHAAVAVSNGVFTVTLDFGPGVFTGTARFLEIGVRTNGNVAAHTLLTPRQPITPTPYALFALNGNAGPQGPVGPQGPAGPADANAITTGTVADARLSSNVARTNVANTFYGAQSFADSITVSGSLNLPSAGMVTINGSRVLHTYGEANTFVGADAGNLTMAGIHNTANGARALSSNTTGIQNTANGSAALNSNTTGDNNTASGSFSLLFNTTGSANTANGHGSLFSNATGNNNTASGLYSLYLNNTGNNNTASGKDSLRANTTGSGNTALGFSAGSTITTGGGNIFLGSNAGDTATTNLASTFIAGSGSAPIDHVYFGRGASNGVATAYTIHGTGGLGTDNAGAELRLAGGAGTGTGAGGALVFQTAAVGASGSAPNALVERMRINSDGSVVASGTVTAPSFSGNGAGLTNLPVASLSGVLTPALLPANVVYRPELLATNVALGTALVNETAARIAAIAVEYSARTDQFSMLERENMIRTIEILIEQDKRMAAIAIEQEARMVAIAQAIEGLKAADSTFTGKNLFTASNRFSGILVATNAANVFVGDGSGLTGLTAAQITTGTLDMARVANGSVTTEKLAVGAVITSAIAPGAVAGDRLGDGAVTAGKLAGGSVVETKIADGNVTDAKLAFGINGSKITGGDLAATRLVVGTGHSLSGNKASIAGGQNNTNSGTMAFLGGGWNNTASGNYSFVGGGQVNRIQADASYAIIVGGDNNTIHGSANNATVGGGAVNTIQTNASYATIGGGFANTILTNASYATIPGGQYNAATNYAFAAGNRAKANHSGAFVWADSTIADFASTAANEFSVRASGGARFELGSGSFLINGQPVFTGANAATLTNLSAANLTGTLPAASLSGTYSSVLTLNNAANTVAGNGSGLASLNASAITSGTLADARLSANVPLLNGAPTFAGAVTASSFRGAGTGPLELFANGARALRMEPNASGAPNMIGGSVLNYVSPGVIGATIGGGGAVNLFPEFPPEFAMTYSNSVLADFGTVSGGAQNTIQVSAHNATIGGGRNNEIQGDASMSTIGGGFYNTIRTNAYHSTIAGGTGNEIWQDANNSTIGGGNHNTLLTNAHFATIPGGEYNTATNYAFAAGRKAKANHTGAFVWADSTDADFASTAANEFSVRAGGGVRMVAGTTTATLTSGSGAWSVTSDRNAKKDFAPVDSAAVLEKLAAVPVLSWRYKTEAADSVPHLGPVAQEFKAAFFPGRDDKSISTLEFDGVELAAIQGLHQMVKQQDTALKAKDAQIQTLEQRLAALETLVRGLAK